MGNPPEHFRRRLGFGALQTAAVALFTATPALSAPVEAAQMAGIGPIIVIAGALGFGLLASLWVRQTRRQSARITDRAYLQMAEMRAEMDFATGVLDGLPEVTMVWRDTNARPRVYGQTEILVPRERDDQAVSDFHNWLDTSDAAQLVQLVASLKASGRSFDASLVTLDGSLTRIYGRVLGGAAIVRVRRATLQPEVSELPNVGTRLADPLSTELVLDNLAIPAWIRRADGQLTYANKAYRRLADQMGIAHQPNSIPELLDADKSAEHFARLQQTTDRLVVPSVLKEPAELDLILFAITDGAVGLLRQHPKPSDAALPVEAEFGGSTGIINAIATPIAIFDTNRKLIHFNTAYADFWDLDVDWLNSGVEETAVLDRLRTQGQLPSEADYRAWRGRHLKSYNLQAPREERWYLPDGRTINVVSVPASANAGVIYVFQDITEQLALESRYNALIHVQSETLGALSEGVAVFGTNGRLTLHNPRLSLLWKLPMNELGKHPHIDDLAKACAASMPEDGASIWVDLKQSIIDLNPARTDRTGRITRADGRMIDYTVTRLPDGQTMMTFEDVTESASYQRVLKERNDALVTADRLKDAFVQNVSYELRSPLTNIIGFADLLASENAGELNDKQRSYTDYIRASSQTLGVLIDNILDLATVDAGVAELRTEPQDITKLIERARAGLAGTLSAGGDETPPNIIVDMEYGLPTFVADGTRIVQVLYNLLSNSVRFSKPGAPVHLNVSSRSGRIIFSIEDEGAGISDEMRAALFQRFEGRSTEGRQRGAGLGLAIVKTFVSLHGGTVSLEKRDPKGTRVIVSIPANPAEAISAAE